MVRCLLFLLLLKIWACSGFGFKSCTQNFPNTELMWCQGQNIGNISKVLSLIPRNTTKIALSKNRIKVIPPGSFEHLPELKELDLGQNKLFSLNGGEFRGLHFLHFLNLTRNNMSHIHPKAFHGLTSLRTLILSKNLLTTIFSSLFPLLPVIQYVDLSLNHLKAFTCAENTSFSTLRRLNLFANKIQMLNVSCFPALEYIKLSNNSELELQAEAFTSNHRLRILLLWGVRAEMLEQLSVATKRNLSWVSFSLFAEKSPVTICGLVKEMDHLEKLEVDLKGSRLPQTNSSLLDCATPKMFVLSDAKLGTLVQLGKGNTTTLYLNNCGIKKISPITFEGYEELKTLQLNENNIIVERGAFKALAKLSSLSLEKDKLSDLDPVGFVPLRKLTYLNLAKNEITELRPKVFMALTRLEKLYLQFNILKYITKKPFSKLRRLRELSLSQNIIYFIEEGTFEDLTHLTVLDLSGNRIKRLTPRILCCLVNLKTLLLQNNHLHFESYEAPFINLTSLTDLVLDYQGLEGRGIGSFGPQFFQSQRQLTQLKMGGSINIDFHPDTFMPLVNLKRLRLSGMSLRTINLTTLLSPLKNLTMLKLKKTDLDALPTHLLPPGNSLLTLLLQSNHLRTVDKMMLDSVPRLRILELRENPLSCTCDNAWFKAWAVANTRTQVSFLYNLRCDNIKKSPYLWQFDDKACSYEWVSLILFVVCSVIDVLFVSLCLVWHTQGPTLRYLLLILKVKLRGRKGAAGVKYQYDAFVSYSSKDEAWVIAKLVPNLERPASGAKLRLCLHHRDFRPGAAVLENIEAAIYNSRHTICVVTRHFLRSEWCSIEFQLASLRLLCDGSDVLLLVFLEEIPEHCLSPYTQLRKILQKRTYLLWPEDEQEQQAFWVRLIHALKDTEEGTRGGVEDGLSRLVR